MRCNFYTRIDMKDNSKLIEAAKLVVPGAICGDIIGSAYESHPTKNPGFSLLTPKSRFTDDTVCTIALAETLNSDLCYTDVLKQWCRRHINAGYGGTFIRWILSDNINPYNSWGNGSAMRVSAAGAFSRSLDEVMTRSKQSAAVTHNHPEGIKGAQATAVAIYLALRDMDKAGIKSVIEKGFGYDLSRRYTDIQRTYSFDVSCQGSVPEAIIAFLESSDYESAVRLAVALGGDADTQGAIAGGIAAAYYKEIPDSIMKPCLEKLPQDMMTVIDTFNRKLENRHGGK